ncbi:MAG: hypothetical protein ABSA52_15065 [Candidatus Binatia bacterium]
MNLPVGDELKYAIAASLAFRVEHGWSVVGGDPRIVEGFRQLVRQPDNRQGDINPYLQAAALIRDAMPQAQSIDNFIDSHRSDSRVAECGKLAIGCCILKAERASPLYVDRSNIYNKIRFADVADTWFNRFFQLIAQSCQRDEVADRLRKIAVISFNYDRCLEHFLHGALQNYYSMSPDQATTTLRSLDMFHPYGTVGSLPWTDPSLGVDYGGELYSQHIGSFVRRIRTFAEGTDETGSDIVAIRSTLRSAERVAFLGFAFHRLNLELLFGAKQEEAAAHDGLVYATALGLSDTDAKLINRDLAYQGGYRPENIHLYRELTASQLFNEHSRGLDLQ